MTTLQRPAADISPRKRSFDFVVDPPTSSSSQRTYHRGHGPDGPVTLQTPVSAQAPSKRRSISPLRKSSMPAHIASVMSTAYPSFMSVYRSDGLSMEKDSSHADIVGESQKDQIASLAQLNTSARPSHNLPFAIQHRGSFNSFTASAESSPTTTNSTFDSPSLTDPSPSSSPESASSLDPLTPFQATMQPPEDEMQDTQNQTFPIQQTNESVNSISEPPNLNVKNVKNLSLNMAATILSRPATSAGNEDSHALSVPTSPLKETPRTGRKKPTNLTIRTPGFQQLSFARTTSEIPPTPSSRPSLQNFQSSPSLPSLATPNTASSVGLHLTLPPFINGHSRPGSDSSFSSLSVGSNLPGLKEEDEFSLPHKSQETQERGYPTGPIQIYDSGVYLYLEPTLEEAGQFDTVINVAKEIKNPFENNSTANKTIMSIWRGDADRAMIPEPQTAISEMSFKSAWEFQPTDLPTPTTPRPASNTQKNEPEYLHVQWDHNSEILQDLYPLCRVIDDRVNQGKKVLIHCQLGVSRSASLVIAYGLYKGYQPDFHSMYMQVKNRSRWVGPNMSLIYQLTDFRTRVARGEYNNGGRSAPPSWFKNAPTQSSALKTPDVASQPAPEQITDPARTPKTARRLPPLRLNKDLPPVPPFPKEKRQSPLQPIQVSQSLVSVLQSIGKMGVSTEPKATPPKPVTQRSRTATRPLPFRERSEYSSPAEIPPHRPRMAQIPVLTLSQARPPSQMDLANQDVPATPSLFSPRATEFMASPFGITAAGDLATHGLGSARSVRSIPPPECVLDQQTDDFAAITVPAVPSSVDPRSPHQLGEGGEILRSIDDLL